MPSHSSRKRLVGGFSLVEVSLALGIASFALMAIIGTLAVAIDSTGRVERSTSAASVAGELLATLREFPNAGNATYSAKFPDFPLPDLTSSNGTLSSGNSTIFLDASGKKVEQAAQASFGLRYEILPDTKITQQADAKARYVTLELWWPPLAPVGVRTRHTVTTGILLP
jgi:type II secretory pathway pseudopilin PulG